MNRQATSSSRSQSGESAREHWERCKALFAEHAKSILAYRLWLETTLNDSSPGSAGVPDSSLCPSDSQST